jgi:hypothetical protein
MFYPFIRMTLPPAAAGAAMAFSSVSVVVSSLWLESYRAPSITALIMTKKCLKEQGEISEREHLLLPGTSVSTPSVSTGKALETKIFYDMLSGT